MSVDVRTDLGTLRHCEPYTWLLWCPVCEDWEKLNEEQMEGRLSVNHAATGCPSGYHERHHFAIEVVARIGAYRLSGCYGDDPVVRHASERRCGRYRGRIRPMSNTSINLKPGARLQHANGEIVTLDRRKTPDEDHHGIPYWPGWWLRDSAGGIADFVIDGEDDETSEWTVLLDSGFAAGKRT